VPPHASASPPECRKTMVPQDPRCNSAKVLQDRGAEALRCRRTTVPPHASANPPECRKTMVPQDPRCSSTKVLQAELRFGSTKVTTVQQR
jgi:hypothetical protein